MLITRLPIPYTDETLYSVAARTRRANAARDDRDACRSLFGPSRTMRVSEFPVNLLHFCAATNGMLGNPLEVLDAMTVTGFYDRVGGRPWRTGSSCIPAITAGYALSTLSNGTLWLWRACAQCVKSDRAIHATAYWRRAHQLPTSFFCVLHNAPLSASVAAVKERHNRFLLPDETRLDDTYAPLARTKDDEALMRLTTLAVDVLQHIGAPVNATAVHATILRALDNRALLTASGAIRQEPFAREFFRHYGFLNQHPEFASAVSITGINILARSLRGVNAWRSATHNILLIDWLFGSWPAFLDQCYWQSVMDYPGEETELALLSNPQTQIWWKTQKSVDLSEKHAHRRACLDFLSKQTPALRNVFARTAPKSFRWLLRYDPEWLDQHCPTAVSRPVQAELF